MYSHSQIFRVAKVAICLFVVTTLSSRESPGSYARLH